MTTKNVFCRNARCKQAFHVSIMVLFVPSQSFDPSWCLKTIELHFPHFVTSLSYISLIQGVFVHLLLKKTDIRSILCSTFKYLFEYFST